MINDLELLKLLFSLKSYNFKRLFLLCFIQENKFVSSHHSFSSKRSFVRTIIVSKEGRKLLWYIKGKCNKSWYLELSQLFKLVENNMKQ